MGKVADDIDEGYFGDWESEIQVVDQKSVPDAWTQARDLILSSKDISEEERDLLRAGSLKTVTRDLEELDAQHTKASKFRRFAAKIRLKPLLDGLVNLDTIISPVTELDPYHIAPLVWGGIRLVILAAQGVSKSEDDLIDFLNHIGLTLSRLQLYEQISTTTVRLTRTLMHVFVKYLSICLYIRDSFVKDGKPRKHWRTVLKFGEESFKGSVVEKIAEIDALCKDAHEEAYLAITGSIVDKVTTFRQTFDSFSESQKRDQEARLKEQGLEDLKQAKRRFMEWLRHFPTHEDFDRLQREKLEGTCQWIGDDRLISTWMRGQRQGTSRLAPSLLWMSGAAGSGKTVLGAHIISQIQNIHPTAYFFCKVDDPRTQKTTAVLQNWIWQLVRNSPVLPPAVTAPSDEYQSPSITALKATILGLQPYLKRSYLIVDGLDECTDDPKEFLDCCQILSQKWSVLVVSRDTPSIRQALKQGGDITHKPLTSQDTGGDINSMLIHKAISVDDTAEDIDKFISQRTEWLANSKGWKDLQEGIAKVLSTTAEGMFLWVKLVLDFLLEDATLEGDVEKILSSIPSDMHAFYDQIVGKILANPSRWRIAQKALHWMVYSFRSLAVEELHAVIAFESNGGKPIENFETILQSSCGLLIRIDAKSRKINLIHATVKEYLLESKDISIVEGGSEAAHGFLSTVCLNYLCSKLTIGLPIDPNPQKAEQRFQSHLSNSANQFLDYSAIYWCQHINRSTQHSAQWEAGLHELLCSEDLTVNWLQIFQYSHSWGRPGADDTADIFHLALLPDSELTRFRNILEHPKLASIRQRFGLGDGKRFLRWDRFLRGAGDLPDCFPIILIAAHFNYVSVITKELRRRVSIETKSHRGGTALLWAARSDSIDAVRLLLTKRANPNDQSRVKKETALAKAIYLEAHLTSFPGTYPVVQVLLDGKADPGLVDRDGLTLLNTLIISSHNDGDGEIAVVKQLLKHTPGLWKVRHETHGTILRHAVLRDRPNIANAILEEVATQNQKWVTNLLDHRFDNDEPLHLAIREQPRLVPVLVKHGANVASLDARMVSPLNLAARYDRPDAIKCLMSIEEDVQPAEGGESLEGDPSQMETFQGESDQSELENGEVDDAGLQEALGIACESQSMEAISVLIDSGAVIDELPDSILLLNNSTTLDDRLEALIPGNFMRPLSVRDVYHIAAHFREIEGLPIPVIARIFDFAELWIRSSTMRDEGNSAQLYNRDGALAHRIFLRSAPVVGRAVEKVTFTITSHDQGFCSNRAEGIWTWFECWRHGRGDSTISSPWTNHPAVAYNDIHWNWRIRNVNWLRSDGREGWDALKQGDRICMLAYAMFPGWINFVKDIRVDVYTSILRSTYTVDEAHEFGDDWVKYVYQNKAFQSTLPRVSRPQTIALTHRPSERSRLQILAAEYGALDITEVIRELVIDNHTLKLDKNRLTEYFTNPFPGAQKVITFIYRFGDDDLQLFIAFDGLGTLLLEPGISTSKAGWYPKHPDCEEHILAIIWGNKEYKTSVIYDIFYAAIIEKKDLRIKEKLFGKNPWLNNPKSCIVYSRKEGTVFLRSAKEDEVMKFSIDNQGGNTVGS